MSLAVNPLQSSALPTELSRGGERGRAAVLVARRLQGRHSRALAMQGLMALGTFPGGLVVRISRSHRDGRGSIPRLGRVLFLASLALCGPAGAAAGTSQSPRWSSG